ncbi:hypothetical protein [Clostridium felsineum]|uniref:Uncharacterized protein n=1 Tax=Clostridium felsineum TaxID=36839 RepID=A0A1S8MGM1_9CLOT|nr:hypothetical protein [Clostridium felsineum]URZ07802.1 hypothetical protein CLROS_031630 [Clostridium felsineum]URZ12833.1 hypothetical protein CROST_035780 [Clostridium felsineum]
MGKIGISTGEMESLAMEISQSRSKLEEVKRNLNSAINSFSLKNKSKSTEIELTNLHNKLKEINSLEDKMEKMNSNVIYVITKFTEMDKNCASRIKSSGYDYRKKIGLLTLGEKIGDNPVGNAIDSAESWYDRNKFIVKKVGTIVLETVAIGVCIWALPEAVAAWGFWEFLGATGAVFSVDNIVTASTSIYQREVQKKSEEDSTGIDMYQTVFGGLGWYGAKAFGAKDPSYWCSSFKTFYDRMSGTITVLNMAHGCTSIVDDYNKLPNLKIKASSADQTLKTMQDAEKIHKDAMLINQNKINEINNAKKEVIDLKKLKSSIGKSNFEPYKNKFYNDKNLLKRDANKLPQLQQDLLKQQDELGILKKNTLKAQNVSTERIKDLNDTYKDIKANKYNIPAGFVLYNTEGTKDSFHFSYVPEEVKSIEGGIKSIFGGKK